MVEWLNSKSDSQVISCPQKKKIIEDFIFIGSEVYSLKKVKNADYIMTYSVKSFDVT